MKVKQAYRYVLDPTPAQERALRSHAGASRFAWNWGLAKCKDRHESHGKWYSAAELHKLWNVAKKADLTLAWWAENSKCAYQEAFRDLDRALRDFIKSKKGRAEGPTARLSAVQEARQVPRLVPVHDRRDPLRGNHGDAAPARHDPHP